MTAKKQKWRQLGDCTMPLGKKGPWEVSMIIKPPDYFSMADMRVMRDSPELYVPPGEYKRLVHRGRQAIVMSNTPMEIKSNRAAYDAAEGDVLVNGLGMGMLLEALLHKVEVRSITVIELSQELIDFVGAYYQKEAKRLGRDLLIERGDAFKFVPPFADIKFDYVWHDIWDEISPMNLLEMTELSLRWRRWAKQQGFWMRDYIRRELRRENSTMEDVKRWYARDMEKRAVERASWQS